MSDKHRTLIGLDPGASTGVAIYIGGKLDKLATVEPWRIPEVIQAHGADRVVFEDSRLTSYMFTTVKSRPAALKMARNVGEVDAWCKLIVAVCDQLKIPAHSISPKNKGSKLNAKEFAAATGWDGKSNQHERDASMCAHQFRNAA